MWLFIYLVKGLVHPKILISLCFTLPRGILGVYDFLLSDESNQNYIKHFPGTSKLYSLQILGFTNSLHILPGTASVYDSQQKWEKSVYYVWNMEIH